MHIVRHNYTSIGEEIFNAVSHGAGAILGIIAWAVLLILSLYHRDESRIIGLTIYSLTLILMYLASTLFHSLSFTRAKKVFRILDHASVFLFIAGTYTPFLLLVFPGRSAVLSLGIIWFIAVMGIIFKIFFVNQLKLSLLFYLALGWAGLSLFRQPLLNLALNPVSRDLLIIGGGVYTVGIVFYLWKQLAFNHGIWHLFVLGGSTCHFVSLLLTVANPR